MPIRADSRRRGVSLFEAVAAMAIVGIVAISALEAVGSEMRTAERARRTVEAAALAQSRLDWLDFMNATAMQALPDSVKKGTFDPPLDDYAWTTDAVPIATQPGMYDVAVRVLWAPNGVFELRSFAYRRPTVTTGSGSGRGGRGGDR